MNRLAIFLISQIDYKLLKQQVQIHHPAPQNVEVSVDCGLDKESAKHTKINGYFILYRKYYITRTTC